jgi:hypothetical protein
LNTKVLSEARIPNALVARSPELSWSITPTNGLLQRVSLSQRKMIAPSWMIKLVNFFLI